MLRALSPIDCTTNHHRSGERERAAAQHPSHEFHDSRAVNHAFSEQRTLLSSESCSPVLVSFCNK